MITSFDAYERAIGTLNTAQGGHLRPNRNFIQWLNSISMELFEELVTAAGKTQTVDDRLNPFLKSVDIVVPRNPGTMHDIVALPEDYEHYSSARVFLDDSNNGCRCKDTELINGEDGCPFQDDDEKAAAIKRAEDATCEVSVKKVPNQNWGSVCGHRTKKPSFKKPVITQYDGGLKVAPKDLGIITLDYYRKPQEATFEYDIVNPGTIDEYYQFKTTSKPLEWSATLINEFVNRIGIKYGKYIREPFMYQASVADKNAGI